MEFSSEGCLPFFALPPLAVVVVGLILALVLTRVEWNDSNTQTAEIASVEQDELAEEKLISGESRIAALFTPQIQYWSADIINWSQKWGLDPNLVATVMQIESCGDPRAVSGVGAMGLFQVMQYHFVSGEDPYQPGTNARRGLSFLKSALEAREGSIKFGLAGYNGGITGARRPESAWSNEMDRYVYWGTGIYADAQKGRDHSDRLDEWLAFGGASLCKQAGNRLGISQ
ncbi:MAG: transglycosylase SLT domain-containing protein [Anaerolineales bacterium]|nr:transglycosylase SLT domain-containing protein [Chloroflexota bacterium]MBL6981248.1 transglycosylase SLT domain-containing protein [Anaerolineales bacterium]